MEGLVRERLPQHVAIIMDGNGRWARRRHLPRVAGHRKGIERVREIIETSLEIGIRYLTLYAFSKENWRRPSQEVRTLMELLEYHLREELPSMMEKGIQFRAIGDRWELSPPLQELLSEIERRTSSNSNLTLCLALSYGGRAEILKATREIARKVLEGKLQPEEIDEDLFSSHLYTSGIPDPDLLIRTSGEYRISNFLLWQSAYTELYITHTYWPDFNRDAFIKALKDYQQRERRFGLTTEQLRTGVR